jgi:hypothetical protein
MSFENLKARFDQILADLGQSTDARASASGIFDAMVDLKAAIASLKEGLERTDRELSVERQQLEDAERRGRLAAQIQDAETAELATIWANKHRERVEILERKRPVQADELGYAERQLADMSEAYRKAKLGVPPGGRVAGAAGAEPAPDLDTRLDRQAQDALVQQQLAHLKKKLGRSD